MPVIRSDIRLIDGDLTAAVKVAKEYLPAQGYALVQIHSSKNFADIKVHNFKQSIIKLYITNSPQIANFHLRKKSNEQIQIEIKYDLFQKFRIFYYICLNLFLTGCGIFIFISSNFVFDSSNSQSSLYLYSSYGMLVLLAFLCFSVATMFYMRSISTFSYENFTNKFYEALIENGFSNRIDIRVGHSFPDMWKVLYLYGIFCFAIFLYFGIDLRIFKSTLVASFLFAAIITIAVLIVLLFKMQSRPIIQAKLFFALAGISLCIPITFYISPPIILYATGKISHLFEISNDLVISHRGILFGSKGSRKNNLTLNRANSIR